MSVAEMERLYYELKAKFDRGAIGARELESQIANLRFQDAQKHWWSIGIQTGQWYMYDGSHWIPGQPPAGPAASPSSPRESNPVTRPRMVTEAAPTPAPPIASDTSTAAKEQPVPVPVPQQPMPAVPAPARLRPVFRSSSSLRGLILIECVGLLAIVLVFILLVAGDKLGSGKPISSASESLTVTDSSAAIPTPLGAPFVTNGADITNLVAAGDDLVLQSQFDPAIAQYETAAQTAPSSPTPLSHWSRVLAFRGQMHDAVAKAHQATQRAPNDSEAQAQLARALAWSGVNEDSDPIPEALAAGEKAVHLDPQNSDAHAYLAEIYLLVKRPADAQKEAQAALELAPQSAEAHRSLAWVLTLGGQKDAALAEWRQTVALEPQLFFRHFEFGEVLRIFFHDPVNAASEYQKAVALYGAYVPSYTGLGLADLDANQPQNAISQFQRAIKLAPENDDNYADLGLALGRAGQCPQAIPYFEQGLKIDANNVVAAKGLAECKSGKRPSAVVSPAPTTPLVPPSMDAKEDE